MQPIDRQDPMSSQSNPPDPPPKAASPAELEDERLIAEANAPPTIDEAREMLTFWEQRLAGTHVYERARKTEATEMVERSRQRVRDAERARYGPSALKQLLAALGVRRLPRRELISMAKKGLVLVAILLVLIVIAIIALWSDIEPVLRGVIQLGNEGGRGG
jgi:hypothetical protein